MLPICPNLRLVKLVPSTCGLSVAVINGYYTYSVCLTAGKWLMKCWKCRDGSSAGISVWCQRPSRVPFSSKMSESPESTVGERGQMHALKSRSTKTCTLMCSLLALRDKLFFYMWVVWVVFFFQNIHQCLHLVLLPPPSFSGPNEVLCIRMLEWCRI